MRWLFTRRWRAIFTTNYDALIERSYELDPTPPQNPVVFATNSELKTFDPRIEVPVYHLHGSLATNGGQGAILITQRDDATFSEKRSMLFNVFATEFATTPILYIGYSHQDPNWLAVTSELRRQFGTSEPPVSYRLTPSTPDLDREILAGEGIETIDGDLAELRKVVTRELGTEVAAIGAQPEEVPADLSGVFTDYPAPLLRLLNRWTYVNQANFADQPNTADFLGVVLPTGVSYHRVGASNET